MKEFFKKIFTKKKLIIFSVSLVVFILLVFFGPDTTINYDWIDSENGIGYHNIHSNHIRMTCPGDWLNESVSAYVGEHGLGEAPYKYTLNTDTLTLVYAKDYNKDKKHPASFTVSYLTDQTTPVKEQAEAFASTLQSDDNYKFINGEEASWEDVGRFYYLNKDKDDSNFASDFPSYVWDIVVWKYEYIDKSTNQKCETLFFERADGFYTIDMKYPKFGKEKKEEVYTLFEKMSFLVDLEIDKQMDEALSCTQERMDNGDLIVTVTYEGDVRIDQLNCQLSSCTPEGSVSLTMAMEPYVEPGETVVFTFDAETLSNYGGVEPRVFASWHAHDIEDGSDTVE